MISDEKLDELCERAKRLSEVIIDAAELSSLISEVRRLRAASPWKSYTQCISLPAHPMRLDSCE